MDKDNVLKGLKACKDFTCGECPYKYLESKDHPLRCIHTLMIDLNETWMEMKLKEKWRNLEHARK